MTPTTLQETEKAVAVHMRREFPDLLPTTDAWRPIVQRILHLAEETAEVWEAETK